MTDTTVRIRELTAWGFDSYGYRPKAAYEEQVAHARDSIALRKVFEQTDVVLATKTEQLRDEFAPHAMRPDLMAEMSGLSWSIGIVDLRTLIAFQRRLVFNPHPQFIIPNAYDWPALISLSFGAAKPIQYESMYDRATRTLTLRSTNPNLHLRVNNDAAWPISVHAGGPFLEVAHYRERWFLRDGYHRAYALLRAGVFEVPAVIVWTRTIDQVGAIRPWFFPEDVLFSTTPPLVADFLNDDLVIEYTRPPLVKTLRITMEESLAPAAPTGEQS